MDYTFTKIDFWLNGTRIQDEIPPGQSTFDYLHFKLQLHGTKCSCNEGDCGACTVAIGSAREGAIVYEAVNSCLFPAARLHRKHLITIESLGTPDALHPIQEAMLNHHATQCGYCSPGFVMSAFALLAMKPKPSRDEFLAALEGNLCRCTGYDSILKAMLELGAKGIDPVPAWARKIEPELFSIKTEPQYLQQKSDAIYPAGKYLLPQSLEQLFAFWSDHPAAVPICGGTDIMVQVNISRRKFPALLDLTQIPELRSIKLQRDGLHIGATATYSDVYNSGIVKTDYPCFASLIRLIASEQIRNSGSIVGNIANASPIGDSLPLLLVLEASLVLQSTDSQRTIPLKDFFLSYRKTALQPFEIIREIIIPPLPFDAFVRISKAAKRKSVDISTIASAIRIELDSAGQITKSLLAYGGAAAVPMLSFSAPFDMTGKRPSDLDFPKLASQIAAEFTPISDVRGSADYRKQLIANQVIGYLTELSGRNK